MSYDEKIAERIRKLLPPDSLIREQQMFGGIAFLRSGKLFIGVMKHDHLLVRCGKDSYAATMKKPHVGPMDFTGRAMTGFVVVDPKGFATAAALRGWITRSLDFVATLPAKAGLAKRAASRRFPAARRTHR